MPIHADDAFATLSAAIVARVATATPLLAAIDAGHRNPRAGIVWRPGVVVTSEQSLPKGQEFAVSVAAANPTTARLAGRDPGTNVAVLKFDTPTATTPFTPAALPLSGALALVLGADRGPVPSARMAVVRSVGPEWFSMAGGRIDHLLRLDMTLSADGGPVLDAAGALLGMATSGPRGQALVIPHQTIARVLEPLLSGTGIGRAWLGLGLQPVAIPENLRETADQKHGLMVVGLSPDGPAAKAGLLPGDILLTLDRIAADRPNALAPILTAEQIGRVVEARVLRAGGQLVVPIQLAERPVH